MIAATDINYFNYEEICGYQLLMCKIYEQEGGLHKPARTSAAIREVKSQGKIWLGNVKCIIDDIMSGKSARFKLDVIPKLLNAYDFYYRVCNGVPDNNYIRKIRLDTVDLWVKGDKSISQTYLVIELLKEVLHDNRTLGNKYSMFALGVLGEWVKELMRYGKFRDIPLSETYVRLQHMVDYDLFAYLSGMEESYAKARWIKAHQLSDEQLDVLDAETLWSYIGFAQSALTYNRRFDKFESVSANILNKIASKVEINPFLRATIEMTLEKLS